MNPEDEERLLRRIATGDRVAFEEFYRLTSPSLAVRLRRRCADEQTLAEVMRQHLNSLRHQIRHQNIDRAVFLLVNAVPSVIRAAIESDPEGTNDAGLADELRDMILRYLVYVPANESGAFVRVSVA